MTAAVMQAAVDRFRVEGTQRAARHLLAEVSNSRAFSGATPWYWKAVWLLSHERFDEVIRLVESAMPGAFLCPDAHTLLAHAYAQIGSPDAAAEQAALAETAIDAIRRSGSGTEDSPWHALRVIDEHALLADEGFACERQALRKLEGGVFDVVTDAEGTERWFTGVWQ